MGLAYGTQELWEATLLERLLTLDNPGDLRWQ